MGRVIKLKFGSGKVLEATEATFTEGWLSGTQLANSVVDTAGEDGDLDHDTEICLPDWVEEEEMRMVEGVAKWQIRFRGSMLPDVSSVVCMCHAMPCMLSQQLHVTCNSKHTVLSDGTVRTYKMFYHLRSSWLCLHLQINGLHSFAQTPGSVLLFMHAHVTTHA